VTGPPPRFGAIALLLAAVLAGCGGGAARGVARRAAARRSVVAVTARPRPAPRRPAAPRPGGAPSGGSVAAGMAAARRTHEYPGPAPPQAVAGGWRNPVEAVRVFAATYVNWTAATVSQRLRALSEVSIGQARAAMSLAAAGTASDVELHRGGIANAGTVEAVTALPGRSREYVVVTRERTTASNSSAYQGLAPAWHVTLATVAPVTGGLWVLSSWQPES
jgi:hypothetical protein